MVASLDKNSRLLLIFQLLNNHKVVKVNDMANELCVSTRTIHRDICDIKAFYADLIVWSGEYAEIVYDRSLRGYKLSS